MILEQYCQVNSNFFYSEKLNIKPPKEYKKVNLKKLDADELGTILESIVFGDNKNNFIHIKTNKGEFVLLTVTNDITKEQTLEFLKQNSINYPTYYFRNVDYFSFGIFGYAENGKIERYLSYNSEAMGDENIVEWIGKPHKWEYETHTFYTKKKLEECEMFFDWETVCEMIYYYLPFITEEVEILEFNVYTKNKESIKRIKKDLKYEYKKIKKDTLNKLYVTMLSHNINCLLINALVYDDRIVMHDLMVSILKENKEDILDNDVLFQNLISDVRYEEKYSEIEFHNGLVQLVDALPNVESKKLKDVAPYIKRLKEEKELYYILITLINKKRYKIELLKRGTNKENIFIGYNFNKKNSNKIYKIMKGEK